jgi:hypothetical protein
VCVCIRNVFGRQRHNTNRDDMRGIFFYFLLFHCLWTLTPQY